MLEADEVKAVVQKQLERLAKTRDELRTHAQAAKSETRAELHRLEAVWQRVQEEVRQVREHSQGSVDELGGAAAALVEELKQGYDRVKRELGERDVGVTKAVIAAQASATLPFPQAIQALASQIGAHADTKAVFGAPITHAGFTVVPVARVFAGFGAGVGASALDGSADQGAGGGGGFAAVPLGFIEIGPEGARFQRLEGSIETWAGAASVVFRLARSGLQLLKRKL